MRQAPIKEQVQQEQLLSLGDTLRQARLAQGKSLSDIAKTTLIRQPLLSAIESAQVDELPEPVYVRGLLRRYGDALGLDGQTLASQYFTQSTPRGRQGSWRGLPVPQLRPFHLYGAYLLLIAVSVSGLSFVMRQTTPESVADPIVDPEAAEQLMPRQTETAPAAPETSEAPAEALPESPIMVELDFVQQSWVRVVADGKTEFEGILQQGDSRAWSAEQSITVRAGNAGGVVVSYNNDDPQPMGQPGTVAERTFNPEEAVSLLSQ